MASLAAGQKVIFPRLKGLMNKMTNPTHVNSPVEGLTSSIQGMNFHRHQQPPHISNQDVKAPNAPPPTTHNRGEDSNQTNGTRIQTLYREPCIRDNLRLNVTSGFL